jgi:hypothetical protein
VTHHNPRGRGHIGHSADTTRPLVIPAPVVYDRGMAILTRSKDRKVSPAVRVTAKSQTVKSANSFGLPSGKAFSCPGATSICELICYAGKLERLFKGVLVVLMRNWEALKEATYTEMVALLSDMMAEFVAESDTRGDEKIFRIHWDGDFFSTDYARAWATVIRNTPDVQYWVYTRSFTPALNVIPILAGIDNLSVYLSVDAENVIHAAEILLAHPGVKVAALAKTAGEAKEMFPDSRVISCPENVGKLPLVVGTGDAKGACAACGLCVHARNNVAFAISGKE